MDISNLEQTFAGGLLDKLAGFVGKTPAATSKTMNAALPSAMYAIVDHGSTEIGARSLLDALRSGRAPQLDASQLDKTLDDPRAANAIVTTSSGFLEKLMGGKLVALVGGLSAFGVTDRSTASKLLALAAPLALGAIGRRAREANLDAGGLAGFLGDQKSRVASMVPGPLQQFLGRSAPLPAVAERAVRREPVRTVAPPRVTVARAAAPEPRRGAWVWVLVGLAALVGLAWLLAHALRSPPAPSMATPTIPGPTLPVPGVKPPAAAPPEPARIEAAVPASVTTINQYLDSSATAPKRFVMEGITFATGSAALTPEGQTTVTDLANALKAHPGASISVEGFTDATGSTVLNQQLAQSRADSVKSALAAQGVDGSRIQAVGNQQQRRVEVVVTPR